MTSDPGRRAFILELVGFATVVISAAVIIGLFFTL